MKTNEQSLDSTIAENQGDIVTVHFDWFLHDWGIDTVLTHTSSHTEISGVKIINSVYCSTVRSLTTFPSLEPQPET